MTHPLDSALGYALSPRLPKAARDDYQALTYIALFAGQGAEAARDCPAAAYAPLGACIKNAAAWASRLPSADGLALDAIRAEYDRADAKHHGRTPYNRAMSDHDRAAILLEEVGEVARACTPDADTPIGHAGELRTELIQTATMAAAWLARLIEDQEATR